MACNLCLTGRIYPHPVISRKEFEELKCKLEEQITLYTPQESNTNLPVIDEDCNLNFQRRVEFVSLTDASGDFTYNVLEEDWGKVLFIEVSNGGTNIVNLPAISALMNDEGWFVDVVVKGNSSTEVTFLGDFQDVAQFTPDGSTPNTSFTLQPSLDFGIFQYRIAVRNNSYVEIKKEIPYDINALTTVQGSNSIYVEGTNTVHRSFEVVENTAPIYNVDAILDKGKTIVTTSSSDSTHTINLPAITAQMITEGFYIDLILRVQTVSAGGTFFINFVNNISSSLAHKFSPTQLRYRLYDEGEEVKLRFTINDGGTEWIEVLRNENDYVRPNNEDFIYLVNKKVVGNPDIENFEYLNGNRLVNDIIYGFWYNTSDVVGTPSGNDVILPTSSINTILKTSLTCKATDLSGDVYHYTIDNSDYELVDDGANLRLVWRNAVARVPSPTGTYFLNLVIEYTK